MIGSDIIDLQLADRQSNWRRKGFLEKVFTASERKILAASADKNSCVWLLWSMKEAAYKAHQRKKLLPRRLNWTIQQCVTLEYENNKATGIVQIEEDEYFTFSQLTPEVIHTIAVDEENSPFKERLLQLSLLQTKQLFIREIAMTLNTPFPGLQLQRTEAGIPFLSYRNEPFSLAFSFSDHGRFSGFCVSLRES